MSTQQGSRPADPTTTTNTFRTTTHTITTELYEAAFTTRGTRPFSGIAIAATVDEARQRLADMLLFADPTGPTTADIIAFHRADPADHYQGTAGDIYHQVTNVEPGRTVIARPLTSTTSAAADPAAAGER
jgi:hypothetical protein